MLEDTITKELIRETSDTSRVDDKSTDVDDYVWYEDVFGIYFGYIKPTIQRGSPGVIFKELGFKTIKYECTFWKCLKSGLYTSKSVEFPFSVIPGEYGNDEEYTGFTDSLRELEDWCKKNCKGSVDRKNENFFFINMEDAAFFKLTWG